MATVYQRPMPALDDSQPPQIINQRRRRDSIEVIDVDELDDDIYPTHHVPEPGPSRPAQRRRLNMPSEIISLVDDDDDDIVLSQTRVRPAARTRLQSPPPRNQSWGTVPPVPQVPQRYAGQTSFPMRRQGPPAFSPPVVRPNDQPFPFEVNMLQQQPYRQLAPIPGPGPSTHHHHVHVPRLHSPEVLPPRALQAAPPSHHLPSMGLGGALIAHNRPRPRDRLQNPIHRHHEPGHPNLVRVGNINSRRVFDGPELAPGRGPRSGNGFLAFGNDFDFLDGPLADIDEDPDRALALLLQEVDDDPRFNLVGVPVRPRIFRRQNGANTPEELHYRKEYTHAQPPESGFTFDFAPKEPVEVIDVTSPEIPTKRIPSPKNHSIVIHDDGTVSEIGDNTSAGPSQPAFAPSSSARPQTPPKSTSTTTLVCARCLDPLILGNNLTSKDQKDRRVWGLRCGHLIDGKCLTEIGQPLLMDPLPPTQPVVDVVMDRKGKGKAKAVDEGEIDLSEVAAEGQNQHSGEPDTNKNNMRSRLRPRNPTTSTSTSASASSSSGTSQSQTKRNGKGKSTPQQQLPLPEFTWYCPVPGCNREHVSVKVNGEWLPEKEENIHGDSASPASGGAGRGRGARRGMRNRALFLGQQYPNEEAPTRTGGARGAIPLYL